MGGDRWLQSPDVVAKGKSSVSVGNPISVDKSAAINCNKWTGLGSRRSESLVHSSIQHLPTRNTSVHSTGT
jgi:hypothetical protein